MAKNDVIQSRPPKHIPEYAEACLEALAASGLGESISLGGGFGLLHYLDYRSTHDVDERVDFLARLCSAWDFGLLPNPETVTEIRRAEWREAVDACRLLTSPAYHLLRKWHGLPPLPYLGQQLAYIRDDPSLEYV